MTQVIPRKAPMLVALCAGLMALTACEAPDRILPGERLGLRDMLDGGASAEAVPVNQSLPINLPAQTSNASWLQHPAAPATRTENAAFSGALQPLWSANIGAGDTRRGRINAVPVAGSGRIFTLDSASTVTATSTGGAALWTRSLVPPRDGDNQATGGGMALADDALFVSTGFGQLTALNPATGDEFWVQDLDATGSGAPAVHGDLVYLVAGDSTAWAIERSNGRIRWQLDGLSDTDNVLGGPAPAVNDKLVIFSYGSGEIQAAFRKGGLTLWNSAIAGQRRGVAAATIDDITGDPVISGDRVYAGSFSGRMAAMNVDSGERIWTAPYGALAPVWVAGGSVFAVTDRNNLVRLSAEDGSLIWSVDLPGFQNPRRPKRRTAIYAQHGPVLAGGRLYVAGGDGQIRAFDPVSGAQVGAAEIQGGATTAPIVAGGVLYVVSARGQLHAFR